MNRILIRQYHVEKVKTVSKPLKNIGFPMGKSLTLSSSTSAFLTIHNTIHNTDANSHLLLDLELQFGPN
jgi:hypothetical protein